MATVAGFVPHRADIAGIAQQHVAGLGQLDAACRAQEKLGAEFVLELLDLAGQRRQGNVQAGCRPADFQCFGEGNEVFELPEFDASLSVSRRPSSSAGIAAAVG